MFGRSRKALRAEIRDLEARLDTSHREKRATPGDLGLATREMETWKRRAIENADRVVDVELELRECRRELAAHQRKDARLTQLEAANEAAYQVVLTRLPRQRRVRELEAAS